MAENVFGPVDYSLTSAEQNLRTAGRNFVSQSGLSNNTLDAIGRTGRNISSILAGGRAAAPVAATVNVKSVRGNAGSSDLRARLRVPASYVLPSTSHGFNAFPGIIFPYTPSISYDVKADYSSQSLVHSNFAHHFYQRSSLGTINLTAKFTVQNEPEAVAYLATLHLLKSLTKMRTGNDALAGSPPPICRLSAYGPFMIDNAPVAVNNFRVEHPDTIDYFTLGKQTPDSVFGTTAVPVLSSFTISFIPMFSRNEMQKFTVTDWLRKPAGDEFKKKGYL